jgi:hypothetical protein
MMLERNILGTPSQWGVERGSRARGVASLR